MVLPVERIVFSHTNQYFRNLILSPYFRCLFDLWLYVYCIEHETTTHGNESTQNEEEEVGVEVEEEEEEEINDENGIDTDEEKNVTWMSANDDTVRLARAPLFNTRIIYWPSYKDVLGFNYPAHVRNIAFQKSLDAIVHACSAAHVHVGEIGLDNLVPLIQYLSPLSMLSLSLSHLPQDTTVVSKTFGWS
ncbi:hypothetical protein RFI_28986, partial [Reticulomyxa filosa]